MNEKIIAVGKPSRIARNLILIIGCVLILVFILLYSSNAGNCRFYEDYYFGRNHYYNNDLIDLIIFDPYPQGIVPFLACLTLDLGIILIPVGIIMSLAYLRVEMTVTDKRVFGVASFGRRVDLPLDNISAVGTSLLKSIAVASSSGKIKFVGIENRDEIHKAITDLLLNRQEKTKAPEIKQEVQQSNADELKKYKELLDSGIITQEEFDAKKKQLLGL